MTAPPPPLLIRVRKPTDKGPIPPEYSRCTCCSAPLSAWSGEDTARRVWGKSCYLRATGRPKLTARSKAAEAAILLAEHEAEQRLIATILATTPRGELMVCGRALHGYRYGEHVVMVPDDCGNVRGLSLDTRGMLRPLAEYLESYATRRDLSEHGRESEREKTRAYYAEGRHIEADARYLRGAA